MESDTGGDESGRGRNVSEPENEGTEQGESGSESEGGKSDNESEQRGSGPKPGESNEELGRKAQEVLIAIRKLFKSFTGIPQPLVEC